MTEQLIIDEADEFRLGTAEPFVAPTFDISQVDPSDMAEAIRRATLALSTEKKRGINTRGPASVGVPYSGRALLRAQGKRSNLSTHLAVDFDDRIELVAVRRAPKRVSGGRTR